jgi:signal transduction histidine kinase/CheY-like chemotaxis protein
MKKSLLIAIVAGLLLIAVNFLVFKSLMQKQVNYQKNILFSQAKICASDIDKKLMDFENDLNFILFSDDISELFSEHSENSQSLRKLELFYSSYANLIKNIDIYDNEKNVFNLFKDKQFISDKYVAQRQRKLVEKEQVKVNKDEYHYFIPVFKDREVYGNILVTVNLSEYLIDELQRFYLDEICYQWVIDPETGNNHTNFPGGSVVIDKYDLILADLNNNLENLIRHQVTSDSVSTYLITVYKPITVLDHKFGLAFSYNNTFFIKEVFSRSIFIIIVSILLFALTAFILIREVGKSGKKKRIADKERDQLHSILYNLPIGVIIFNDMAKIEYINQLAREMFLIKEGEEEAGNSITEKFIMAGKKIKTKSKSAAYDCNQFILYEKEGNEIILFRKENPVSINNREFVLSAFIDITSLEKSRKYEAAANLAKSEFLAKMSHEIRTPMNGIIGMTDALNNENLTNEQKNYVDIVKRSADLLLNIIDDILDYSKIEAGKMQLEEFPFRLSEEVKLSLDLFRAIIDEKGVNLTLDVDPDVPDEIIGDPFRLRQVLSNLISNSVKFTHEGEIRLIVRVDEKYNGNLTLLFEVADTGVGIPKERMESIFSSFTQAEQSTSRKYGGSGLGTTIAKQLVNLMHGEIWVESPSGISKNKKYPGSKFSFTIEVYSNEEIQKDLDFSKINSFDQIKAFLIGQNNPSRKQVENYLHHLGMITEGLNIEGGDNLIENIKLQLEQAKVNILFILDEPNFDGLYIARQLNHEGIFDRYRVIMISSKHVQENYVQTKVAKVDCYLIQPFEQSILKLYFLRCFPSIKETRQEHYSELREDLQILVAEDNLINQKVAESIFNKLGYTIDLAYDGKEVVEKVKKNSYDIIFMDLQMPEKDGVDATVEIRGLGFQMPIVAMTATDSKIGKDNALTSGMNDYITKPVKVEAVRNVLQKWFS